MSDNITISSVPPELLHLVWHNVKPLFQRALDHTNDEYTVDDIKQLIEDGETLLLVVSEGETILAACGMDVVQYPSTRNIRVSYLGGINMDQWLLKLVQSINLIAKEMEVKDIEVVGRRGWVKKLCDHGYVETYTTVVKRVE